jgi:hypothetical protein
MTETYRESGRWGPALPYPVPTVGQVQGCYLLHLAVLRTPYMTWRQKILPHLLFVNGRRPGPWAALEFDLPDQDLSFPSSTSKRLQKLGSNSVPDLPANLGG